MTALSVTGEAPWATTDYDSFDVTTEKVGTQKAAYVINNEKTTGTDTVSFSQANWGQIAAKDDASDKDEQAITYQAKVPAQKVAVSDVTIANATFTVGWDMAD